MLLVFIVTIDDGCRLTGRQHNCAVGHDDDRSGATTIGGVNDVVVVLGVLDKALNRSRFRTHNSDDVVTVDKVAKTNVERVQSASSLSAAGKSVRVM